MEDLHLVADGGRLIAESASSCGDKLERSDWAGTHTVTLDDAQVGVRWNDDEVGELLAHVFGALLVPNGAASPEYSLVRQPGESGASDSYLLYGGSTVLIDSTSLNRAVRGLVRYLDAHRIAEAPGRLRLAVTAVVGPVGAALGPAALRGQLLRIEGRLNERDHFVLDAPWVYVDPDTADLVWEPIGLDVDLAVLDDQAVADTPSADAQAPESGRFPIGSLSFLVGSDRDGPLGPSSAVLESASLLVNPADLGASGSLVALQALTRRIHVSGFTYLAVEDLLEPFTAVAQP